MHHNPIKCRSNKYLIIMIINLISRAYFYFSCLFISYVYSACKSESIKVIYIININIIIKFLISYSNNSFFFNLIEKEFFCCCYKQTKGSLSCIWLSQQQQQQQQRRGHFAIIIIIINLWHFSLCVELIIIIKAAILLYYCYYYNDYNDYSCTKAFNYHKD